MAVTVRVLTWPELTRASLVHLPLSDPDDKVLLEGQGEKQGDYIFTANTVGEYSFCFENEASLTDRMIDFE